MSHPAELWTWDNCSDKIRSLPGRNGLPEIGVLKILGYELDAGTGAIQDSLSGKPPQMDPRTYRNVSNTLFYILSAYSTANNTPASGKHISSKQFRGTKFTERSYTGEIMSLVRHFESNTDRLIDAAKILGGGAVNFPTGDVAIELHVLPMVPVTVVMKNADEEFSTEAWIYFDESIESYFDAEQTYFLAHLTVSRLIEAANC
ncbi:DUF3786 domain-containing protein [Candidatus Bathyarchaeota archaeon]|nr:DUF3786 domain-containing protein [Candidatus Bathyarchaeota archaeon]